MASETIVAVYDTPAHADLAIADLEAAGIPATSIQHYTGEQYGYGSYDAARDSTGQDYAMPQTGAPTGAHTHDPARDASTHAGADMAPATAPATGERSESLWSWLFGDERERHHGTAYDRSLQRGGTVVTVVVDHQHADKVLSILEDHQPVDIEAHASQPGTAAADVPASAAQSPGPATGAAGRGTEEVMTLSQEELQVGKRQVDRGTTRVRRYVVERPIEEQVRLRDEKVSVFRRPVTNATAGADAFTDKTIDVRETAEEAVVSKTARVVEEVVIRKGVEERSETVRDTLRKEEVEITGATAARVL